MISIPYHEMLRVYLIGTLSVPYTRTRRSSRLKHNNYIICLYLS